MKECNFQGKIRLDVEAGDLSSGKYHKKLRSFCKSMCNVLHCSKLYCNFIVSSILWWGRGQGCQR